MKKVMPHVAGVFFSLFGLGVIALLMSYTFEALAFIFPDNFISQIMGMVLFDIAAIAWILAFIYLCKSVMQYAFAFIGFVFALMGTLVMVAIDVMLGGQEMIEAPAWINEALIYGFIAAAVVHVILVYAYKLAGPEISAEISLGVESANITSEAMKQAEEELLRERGGLGRMIAPRLKNIVRQNLGLPILGDPNVIDVPSYDVPDQAQAIPVHMPAQRSMSFVERVKAAGKVLVNPVAAASAPQVYQAVTTSPVPTSDQTASQTVEPAQPVEHHRPAPWEIDPKPIDAPFKFKAAVDIGSDPGVYIAAGTEVEARLYDDERYNLSEIGATYAFARVTPDELHYYQTGEEVPAADRFR